MAQDQQKRPSFWELGGFWAALADPFLEGNAQAPQATLSTSCAMMEFLVHESPRLESLRNSPLMVHLAFLRKISSAEIDGPEKFGEFVKLFVDQLRNLPVGEVLFAPGGWVGATSTSSLVYLVEKESEQKYALVVCNAGVGVNYHPCMVSHTNAEKIKYKTCFRIGDIEATKILDSAFWGTLHSQWLKASEFHRVEVIYDVLLPWVCGKPTLRDALVKESEITDESEWRSPMRAAGSSGWRNLIEAVRYFLRTKGDSTFGELKELSTLLKCEMLALALADMNEQDRTPPNEDQRKAIELGCRTVSHAVLKLNSLDERRAEQVKVLVRNVKDKLDQITDAEAAKFIQSSSKAEDAVFPEAFDVSGLAQDESAFSGVRVSEEEVERYAGLPEEPKTSLVSDILQVPLKSVQKIEEAVVVLVRCAKVCKDLNERGKSGSSYSSRVALQYQIAELIRTVVTETLPVPSLNGGTGAIWLQFPSKEMEMSCLQLVHGLALAYATAWQSFDAPTRAFDSERSVVAMALLAIFDCVLRNDRFGLDVSQVLKEEGGFCISTSVCVANLSLYKLSSTMEIHSPSVATTRSGCLTYFDAIQKQCRYTDLFTFRMPTDKIEIKKYGTSVLFLRKVMERFGYELVPRDNPQPPPEIESLLEWMTSPSTPLANEHPEFGMLRDMAVLFKFLSTMESRESELQRQRIAPSEYVSWALSFEDTSTESSTYRFRQTGYTGLRWEVLNYRGVDLDTADVQVTGFGDRKIYFGEGLVVHSPADISALMNHSGDRRPTEDDVLHSDGLPTFGDTLSRQESEMLMSYLTVPYMRIPLVLAFFSTGDRVTYLFNHGLQALLRASLFDASDWVPNNFEERINTVPVSTPGFQSSLDQVLGVGMGGAANKTKHSVLGTPDGLLLNELRHAPEGTLRPLMKMLKSINDLADASVYSPDAALSLYLIEIAIDVQAFFVVAKVSLQRREEMKDLLENSCRTILFKWLREAMEQNDIETSCMIHSYICLLWTNLQPDEYSTTNIGQLLGSLCFVRNWHGFGLCEPSALLGYGSSTDSSDPPEQRLIRFMQAYGVDTGRIGNGALQKYLGNNRPLYLRVGAKTVRVPNLGVGDDGKKRKLLANVPEQKLFSLIQRHRHSIAVFLDGLRNTSAQVASALLTRVVRIALDTKGTTLDVSEQSLGLSDSDGEWSVESRGKYLSPDKEMTLDIQGGQILWRNDELKPIPDTMTQFSDFNLIFGKQQLHCGVVAHQQHRDWVHVVGTKFDLLLWDEPDDDDQGLGRPKDVSSGQQSQSLLDESFWACNVCTYMNPAQARQCQMCDSPKAAAPPASSANGQNQEDAAAKSPSAIEYRSVLYNRILDPFNEDAMKKFDDQGEAWALGMLVGALRGHYKDKLPFKLLLPDEHIKDDADQATAMAGVKTEHEVEGDEPARHQFGMYSMQAPTKKVTTTTWKEFVLYREREVLHVFNLISHGRKMYRQLVFSSKSSVSFHSLQPSSSLFGACGDLKAIHMSEESLVITRNTDGFLEMLVPSRLLFGVVPTVLLEAYQFWHGSDGVIRGEPLDTDSTWFGAKEIHIRKDRSIVQVPFSKRNSMGVVRSVLADHAAARQRRLVVSNLESRESDQNVSTEIDQNAVLDLCALGFTPGAARLALSKCNGNSAFAAEWLLNPDHAGQVAAAEDLVVENRIYRVVYHGSMRIHASPTMEAESSYFSSNLGTLGFGQEVKVLERSGNWVRIEDEREGGRELWVLSFHPEHGTMLEVVDRGGNESSDAMDLSDDSVAVQAGKRAAEQNLQAHEAARVAAKSEAMDLSEDEESKAKVKLVNLLDGVNQDDPLFGLLSLLLEIEDLSHIMVWADIDSAEVILIELPRLKLRIEPKRGKLFLSDQAGWFICTKSRRYRNMLDAHALLLMNAQREIQFLMPNHEVSRPQLSGKPFSTALLCDRGSFAWLQTMDTRYYLYRVHTSGTFLISQELSASLYLTHLRMLKRDYKEAFRLAPTCTVDVPFSQDEGFIWSQQEKSLDDLHPDAHAVRLKLSLAIMYAREHIRPSWEIHVEYDGYLRKLSRVSAYCRLTSEEEMKVCRLASSATQLIKNRLEMLQKPKLAPVTLAAPTPRVGGSPWNKIQSQTLSYYNNHGTTLKRVQFKPQVGNSGFDGYIADVIFSEHILFDEESGVNRQLGFAFLYQLLTSQQVPGAISNPKSVGDIMARYLHLKLSRWGRETVSQGEVEASNSRHMAQLAALLADPERPWPKLPVDADSVQMLRSGINLYTERGRQSNVKNWLDLVDMEFVQVWPEVVESNDPTCRFMETFKLEGVPNSLSFPVQPALVCDTSCKKRQAATASTEALIRRPLGELWKKYLQTVKVQDTPPSDSLPFDLHSHSAAQTEVAKDILLRLEEDVRGYAKSQRGREEQVLVSDAAQILAELVEDLEHIQAADAAHIRESIRSLNESANRLREDVRYKLFLGREAHMRDDMDFAILTRALISSTASDDLLEINPTLENGEVEEMLKEVVEVLARTNRVSHANRCAAAALELKSLQAKIESGINEADSGRLGFRVKQLSKSLAEMLHAERHYVEDDGSFDPRFLVFEYVFDILLRDRQVDIVRSFAMDVKEGRSHVQQMIMGAGKTTVVAPLLTLLLADGETLVTQVMPTSLLEQTRHIMRTRFAAIITKRVFTLEFDRSCEDSADAARAVLAKLEEARKSRSVICASPDAVKSLFLKYVEHNHSLESVDKDVLQPSSSSRQNKEIVQLRETMQARSDMADCLVPIFDLWKNGVLIMDEVDVLLHPLRSELNFPIGLKDPIDLSGFRWDLPIHLLSAFFPETASHNQTSRANELLRELAAEVEAGYSTHALQRNPHLVLLDDAFYRNNLMNIAARWCAMWIQQNTHDLPEEDLLVKYLCVDGLEDGESGTAAARDLHKHFSKLDGDNMKLLNLGRDWIRVLLPHVLSKIDRVSFGILSPVDLANIDEKRTPLSRKLMAVPFVGKDVPSRSSEFAHPDVVIGLTVLGYRYEGLRLRDIRTIVTQLKADFSRQVGPRDQRPACVLFRQWLEHASKDSGEQLPVLPLPLFQVNDPQQLQRLFRVLQKEDEVITYYLRQHVFPACMNFQSIKISACGHELGSSMLFSKRIGFSGTPSNLLPVDLGECLYEPGSDGKIMHVLSSPEVVTVERKDNWTAKSLLRDVAMSTPPFHALIDTGALITGMDNEQVARYLMEHLPESRFEGVVYLDRSDRKMFLQRSSGKSLHLSQCGVDPSRRFTFYDQVHTTGMDIKQAPDASAVVTIGKDMTFRDYAQGSFRMRGIGQGQTIHLYLIPEVEQLIKKELYSGEKLDQPCKALDVPAWLLINSMKMETIQYSMLSLQELYNCWRKEAFESLLDDCKEHSSLIPGASNPKGKTERLRRFLERSKNPSSAWLARCISLFREPVGFVVPSKIPSPQPFHDKVKVLINENEDFVKNEDSEKLIMAVADRVKYTKNLATEELEAEIVNENEQEQQQQQEEEAEEEQEKVSRYTRDDEQANPWNISHLNTEPTCVIGEAPFYRMSSFVVRQSQPNLAFPTNLLVSDNWFRPRWIGLGDRRLKNVLVVLQWVPKSFNGRVSKLVPLLHHALMTERGMDPNSAALKAIEIATKPLQDADIMLRKQILDRLPDSGNGSDVQSYFAAISLAEAETLRRVLHTKQMYAASDFALVTIEDGSTIDQSESMQTDHQFGENFVLSKKTALTCLRFVNSDMHYTSEEIDLLEVAFKKSAIKDRIAFFEDCLRLRRREKYLWGDTPLAKLFTLQTEWHLLDARAKLQQMSNSLLRILKSPRSEIDLLSLFSRADGDNDGALNYSEMQRFLEELRLGFSPADIAMVVKLVDGDNKRKIEWELFLEAFTVPADLASRADSANGVDMDLERDARWQCSNCTYINFASDVACEVCGYGWSGTLHVPNDKWMCDPAYGGCTFFNPESNFYCEMCNKAKPSLQNVRF